MFLNYQDTSVNISGPTEHVRNMFTVLVETLLIIQTVEYFSNRAYTSPREEYKSTMKRELEYLDSIMDDPSINFLSYIGRFYEINTEDNNDLVKVWNLLKRFESSFTDETKAEEYILHQFSAANDSLPIETVLTLTTLSEDNRKNLGNLYHAGVRNVTLRGAFGRFYECGLAELASSLEILKLNPTR